MAGSVFKPIGNNERLRAFNQASGRGPPQSSGVGRVGARRRGAPLSTGTLSDEARAELREAFDGLDVEGVGRVRGSCGRRAPETQRICEASSAQAAAVSRGLARVFLLGLARRPSPCSRRCRARRSYTSTVLFRDGSDLHVLDGGIATRVRHTDAAGSGASMGNFRV